MSLVSAIFVAIFPQHAHALERINWAKSRCAELIAIPEFQPYLEKAARAIEENSTRPYSGLDALQTRAAFLEGMVFAAEQAIVAEVAFDHWCKDSRLYYLALAILRAGQAAHSGLNFSFAADAVTVRLDAHRDAEPVGRFVYDPAGSARLEAIVQPFIDKMEKIRTTAQYLQNTQHVPYLSAFVRSTNAWQEKVERDRNAAIALVAKHSVAI